MRELTDTQWTVLFHLGRVDRRGRAPVTVSEISAAFRDRKKEWARSPVSKLSEFGFIEMAGEAVGGAQCWKITDAGRALLAEARDGN